MLCNHALIEIESLVWVIAYRVEVAHQPVEYVTEKHGQTFVWEELLRHLEEVLKAEHVLIGFVELGLDELIVIGMNLLLAATVHVNHAPVKVVLLFSLLEFNFLTFLFLFLLGSELASVLLLFSALALSLLLCIGLCSFPLLLLLVDLIADVIEEWLGASLLPPLQIVDCAIWEVRP